MITVRRLLKSWATPPARRPTASIFCAWRSRSSDCRRASSARLRSTPTATALATDANALGPLLVVDLRITHHLVGQVGTALPGDHADLVLSQWHAAVGSVDMRVHTGARLQLERAGGFVEGPDAGERHVEVAHQCLDA